jgi:hypothetical protein
MKPCGLQGKGLIKKSHKKIGKIPTARINIEGKSFRKNDGFRILLEEILNLNPSFSGTAEQTSIEN